MKKDRIEIVERDYKNNIFNGKLTIDSKVAYYISKCYTPISAFYIIYPLDAFQKNVPAILSFDKKYTNLYFEYVLYCNDNNIVLVRIEPEELIIKLRVVKISNIIKKIKHGMG